MAYKSSVLKDLGKGAASFGVGYLTQILAFEWFAFQNGFARKIPGDTLNDFIAYWTSPWNLVGLASGLGLSAVPSKDKSKGREAARLSGRAVLAAEGWGYAQHTLLLGSNAPFAAASSPPSAAAVYQPGLIPVTGGNPTSFPVGETPPTNLTSIPGSATEPPSSFYRQNRSAVSAAPTGPKFFF